MAYLFLAVGIISEVFGTTMLKASEGFTKVFPVLGGIVGFGLALFFVSLAFKAIPLSVAYATWCGVGIIGASLIGFVVWGERISGTGIIGIILIVIGVVLLNATAPSQQISNSVKAEQTYTVK